MPAKKERNSKIFEIFSTNLRYLRKKAGLSGKDFAKLIGLTGPTQISRYEKGKDLPNVQTLIKIADVLNADIHCLITGEISTLAKSQGKAYKETIERLLPFAVEYMATLGRKQIILQQEKRGLQNRSDRLSKNRLAAIDLELQNLNELVDAAEFEFHDATQLLKEKNGNDVSVYFGMNADEETKRSMKQSLKKTQESANNKNKE